MARPATTGPRARPPTVCAIRRCSSSPRGSGLYLSVFLALDWPPARARFLTLAAGLALREALRWTGKERLAPDNPIRPE